MMKKYFSFLTSADIVTLTFLLFLSLIEIVFYHRIDHWYILLIRNTASILFIYNIAKYVDRRKTNVVPIIRSARDWYLVPAILFIYTQTSSIAHSLHGKDYDGLLIAIDRALFGVDPTVWVYQFTHPIITEILQLAYSSYYLFFIALFFEFYRRSDRSEFYSGAMMIVYGFYLSYIGYMLVPAVGPRFTLHDFFSYDTELPGLFLTPLLRDIINSGGGIVAGVTNPIEFVHRDAFPSGHTQLTLTAMHLAFTKRSMHRRWLLVVGSLLIIATVYLRYHYLIDVIAGVCFFFFTVWSGKRLDRWWNERVKNL
ncbi:MAG: phosphatase PAP2 family protein [Ignavibacteriales bacterium]|nr:phosphatase PAP2 family protein [Ignavibacteriales bacterium]